MGSSNALITKLRGRYGQNLRRDLLDAILAEDTLEGVLKHIRREFAPEAENVNTIEEAELALERWQVRKNRELLRFMSGGDRAFFALFLQEMEIQELLRFLRVFARKNPSEQTAFVLHSLFEHRLKMPPDPQMSVRTYLERLVRKPYFRILEPLMQRSEEAIDFDTLDLNLNRWYFHTLRQEAKGLHGDERKGVLALVGSMIDFKNVNRIVHVKRFARSEEPYLRLQMIEGGRLIQGPVLERLLQGATETVEGYLARSPYAGLLNEEGHLDAFLPIREQQVRYRLAWRFFRRTESGLLAALSYASLQQYRMNDLRRILEGRAIGMDGTSLWPYMTEQMTKERG
ncbi:MAG: V-type ATPase subunit [Peptoniphilaceae bacterium]|nr:V-type ATPase subunit [Peptoniphilaceae bacterium]MDY6085132.1 V-type ATPase subunit [Peptoniphilaceae bacterium]